MAGEEKRLGQIIALRVFTNQGKKAKETLDTWNRISGENTTENLI